MAVYLNCLYTDANELKWFQEQWARTGKKLDMGKRCLRFRKLEDLALDVLGEAIRRTPAKRLIAHYEAVIPSQRRRSAK